MEQSRADGRGPLILLEDGHVPWSVCGDPERGEPIAYVRGYATDGKRFFENVALAEHVQQIAVQGTDALYAEIPNLNGGWGLVVSWPTGEVLAAVDRLRTVPLFFYHNNERFAIAASGAELARRFSPPRSIPGQLKFLLFGYVSGAGTLYEHVRQIQPGEIIEYRPEEQNPCKATRYYRFYPLAEMMDRWHDNSEQLADVIGRMFERFRDGFRGERVVVPLSGGLDSRLVAGMLKRMGVENCLCYTYGDDSNEEVQISRQVAEALGYPWRCLPYSPEAFARWNIADAIRAFLPYGCKGVSSPNAHDFAAVMQLVDNGFHGDEAIYFPGHSADMNAGSHIPVDYPDLRAGKLGVIEEILRHHANPTWYEPDHLLKAREGEHILAEIGREAAVPEAAAQENRLACCEMWNVENRQAKYIVNSVRAYEFVGAGWRTLWDYELMDFFLRVPDELRYGEKLYLDSLRRHIFVGDLAALAEIPLAKHGNWKSLERLRGPVKTSSAFSRYQSAIKRQARWQLLKAGVVNPLAGKEDPLIRTIIRLAGLETADDSVSFGDALKQSGALSRLSPEIRAALAPWLNLRLDRVPGHAIYTVLVLAEMTQGVDS